METCLFEGKQICAYDVTDINFVLNYELKKAWRLASDEGKLLCEECGKEVILKARDPRKKIPHFSHKITDEKCPYSNETIRESEEHKKGKMILYNYFKERNSDANITLNYKFPNKRRADLYIEFIDGTKLAVEFQRTELDIRTWMERNGEYKRLNINTLWILSGKENVLITTQKQVEVSFFQQIMLNELEKVAVYLDVEAVKLILARNMKYLNPYRKNDTFEKLFIKAYPLVDIVIHQNGHLECNFIFDYDKAYENYIKSNSERCKIEDSQRRIIEEWVEERKPMEREQPAQEVQRLKELEDASFYNQLDGLKKYYIQNRCTPEDILSLIPEENLYIERFREYLLEFDRSIRNNIELLKQQLIQRDENKLLLELNNNSLWKAAEHRLHFDTNNIPNYINTKISCEDYYFNCHRSVWQSAIFLKITHADWKNKKFNSLEIADWFLETKNVSINFDMYDILYIERFDPNILNVEEVIYRYLLVLENLGYIKRTIAENKCTDFFIKI